MYICPRFNIHIYTVYGKRPLPFVCCKRKMETANETSFSFLQTEVFFLGRQTMKDDRRLLLQLRCPSIQATLEFI